MDTAQKGQLENKLHYSGNQHAPGQGVGGLLEIIGTNKCRQNQTQIE